MTTLREAACCSNKFWECHLLVHTLTLATLVSDTLMPGFRTSTSPNTFHPLRRPAPVQHHQSGTCCH